MKQRFGREARLEEGDRGEFSVWVGEERVASKGLFGFPDDARILAAVERRLPRNPGTDITLE